MVKKVKKSESVQKSCMCGCSNKKIDSCSNAVYGLGVIGAAVYYISTAAGFWMGVLGLLKALVWPAFLVYSLLKWLGI